jgi:hypothetical protein
MMSNEGYRDQVLVCRDCGAEFTFSAGEQEFFASKGLTNSPSRCPSCRAARRNGQQYSAPRAPREQHEAICAQCGKTTTVPFVPRENRPVYCSDCFQSIRASQPRRDEGRGYGGYNDSYSGGSDRRERYDRW